ncbi:uncharacterized protein LOC8259699 isoform X2 [Ricinus communis]|uniref:uncharacterized protein LOC8259699 isoform X2 n=1 Tax=Ricinus communis TaxID=3988 RepID=UPI00201A8E52|nr:uncharacterized protein LOC8259699 isoform X2 [Ricinus communis]
MFLKTMGYPWAYYLKELKILKSMKQVLLRDCTAVRDGQFEDIQHGKLIADAVSKSQNGELRYQLDQGNFGRGVL